MPSDYHVDASVGSDANRGTTPEIAWQVAAETKAMAFQLRKREFRTGARCSGHLVVLT
jgi:hypothetical protein